METNQICWMLGLMTGYSQLHGLPHKTDKATDSTCRMCKNTEETANNLLFVCLAQI